MADKDFFLNKSQYDQLGDLIARFGGDIQDLGEGVVKEASPEYLTMPSTDIEKTGHVVSVDRAIFENLDTFMQAGMQAKDWYSEVNQKILGTFGDSDGTLFLMLLALFSPQNNLTTNFRLASQVYIGVKRDLADPEKKALFEKLLEEPDWYRLIRDLEKLTTVRGFVGKVFGYKNYLKLSTVKGLIKGSKFINTYTPNLQRLFRLYKQSGYAFNRQQVVQELAKHLKKSHALGKDATISAEKVFSFTLNLLDPSYQFEWGWMPVTIDTWMASFFYPLMGKKEKGKLLSKSKNYAYMAKLTEEQAAKYGMKPQELQAVIWVAMIKKAKGANYGVTFDNAIQKNLQKLKIAKSEIARMSGFLDKVVSVVGGA